MGDMDYAKGVDAGRYEGAVNVSNPRQPKSPIKTPIPMQQLLLIKKA